MKPRPVLYVEDEQDDALLVKLAFQRNGIRVSLKIVADGRDAIDYIAGTGSYGDRDQNPSPCLMLLDLNLPVVSGFHVLKWVREESQAKTLPVVIFSSSNHPEDMQRARDLGADDYIVKPVGMPMMDDIIQKLNQKWLKDKCAVTP